MRRRQVGNHFARVHVARLMDWIAQVDELWRASGSVGEFHDPSESLALLHILIRQGTYFRDMSEDGIVDGFISWIWVDDASLDLLREFDGWRNVAYLAMPLASGPNAFIMHMISRRKAAYLRMGKLIREVIETGAKLATFGRFSNEFIIRVKQ